jgi:hypothetical protein
MEGARNLMSFEFQIMSNDQFSGDCKKNPTATRGSSGFQFVVTFELAKLQKL